MPHAKQHNKKLGWNKSSVVTTPDGWNTVVSTRPNAADRLFQDHRPEDIAAGCVLDFDVTEEVLADKFDRVKERWLRTNAAAQLHRILESKKDLRIDKAICFGLGSMCRIEHLGLRSILQLAVFADMASTCK